MSKHRYEDEELEQGRRFGEFMRRNKIADGFVCLYCPQHGFIREQKTDVDPLNKHVFEFKRDPISGKHRYEKWEADRRECEICS